jgi:hypothetical protein
MAYFRSCGIICNAGLGQSAVDDLVDCSAGWVLYFMVLDRSTNAAVQFALATLSLLTALPLPGRRATSVLVGVCSLLVLVDAAAHPRHFDGLWTLSVAGHITGWFEG